MASRPSVIGGTIAVSDSAELAMLDVHGLPIGTQVWNADVGAYFGLTLSTAALDPDVVVEVAGITGTRWIVATSGDITADPPLDLTGGVLSLPGYPVLDTWFAETADRIAALVPALTKISLAVDLGSGAPLTRTETTSGTVRGNGTSFSLQSGATSGGIASLSTLPLITNIRTSKYAIAAEVTKIANIASSDLRMCNITDSVTGNVQLGIIGASSQANYFFQISGQAAVATGIAQSAVDTYDTLIMLNDGTSFLVDINGSAGTFTPQANGTAVSVFGIVIVLATQAAAANTGFRLKNLMIVTEPAV